MDSESAEAARRSRRIRSSDAWPHLARLPARQSHPRLPGHNALPARKWYMLWAAGLRRLVRKADVLIPCRSLRVFVSHTISSIIVSPIRCVYSEGAFACNEKYVRKCLVDCTDLPIE